LLTEFVPISSGRGEIRQASRTLTTYLAFTLIDTAGAIAYDPALASHDPLRCEGA
jgi:hypothetical protein